MFIKRDTDLYVFARKWTLVQVSHYLRVYEDKYLKSLCLCTYLPLFWCGSFYLRRSRVFSTLHSAGHKRMQPPVSTHTRCSPLSARPPPPPPSPSPPPTSTSRRPAATTTTTTTKPPSSFLSRLSFSRSSSRVAAAATTSAASATTVRNVNNVQKM